MTDQDLKSVAFPRLDPSQIARLQRCTKAGVERYKAGRKLIQTGEKNYRFFVVLSGEVEIVDESGDTPKTITVHRPGQFTGEIGSLTGRAAIATAVAKTDCEVCVIASDDVRQILNVCPDLGDIILQAFIARRQLLRELGDFVGARVIGSRYSKDTFRIRDFLSRNRILFRFLDIETEPEVAELLQRFALRPEDMPVVAWGNRLLLRNPSNVDLAEALGMKKPLERTVYDLAIIGAGPAGLAAAVYAASEGLSTVVLERQAPGGQAATSMRIENYLGFPTGITGAELTDRAVLQANKFGALLTVPAPVVDLSFDNAYSVVALEGGETISAKCLLIVTGAQYRKLNIPGCEEFEDSGIYYAATLNEAQMCTGSEVAVVGGGNSAGQAAVFLATVTRKVYLVVREGSLSENMSSYLAQRIEQTPNIDVLLRTEVQRILGDSRLGAVEVVNRETGEARTLKVTALFSFIGAEPRTDWLPPEIEKDENHFVRTGPDLAQSPHWAAKRHPFLLETSRPGVFAAGDVRSGSVRRVASAVGEGAMAVRFVHEHLKEM